MLGEGLEACEALAMDIRGAEADAVDGVDRTPTVAAPAEAAPSDATAAAPKEPTKSALKKAEKLRQQQEKKAAAARELALRQNKEEENRRAALEEAKKVIIQEDPSLPRAKKIDIRDRDRDVVRLRPAQIDTAAAAAADADGDESRRGSRVKVMGWVHRLRSQKDVKFITLQDGTFSTLQCILTGDLARTYDAITLTLQTSMVIYGEMCEVPPNQHAPDDRELQADYFKILGRAPGDLEAFSNIVAPGADPQTMLNNRHLVIRGETASAVLKVTDLVLYGFHKTYFDLRFRQVRTPCMVQTQVEGGSTLFDFKFFDEKAYLTQSSQLYLETSLPAVGNSYCVMPSFRAEKSLTRRHLAEYTHVEAELGFVDFDDLLDHLELVIVSVVDFVLAHSEGRALVEQLNPGFRPPQRPFLRMTYADAIAWLNEHGIAKEDGSPHVFGDDITEAPERRMTDIINRPIFLTYFPAEVKAFYMKRQDTDSRTTESVDCLMPNVGEIVGGSMRMQDLTELLSGYDREGISPKPYYWYTDQRK